MILRRRTKSGATRYGVRIDRAGRQVWVGTYDTIALARKAEAQALLERKTSTMTCDGYVEFFLEGYRERVKESSFDTGESALRGFAEDFRGVRLDRVDPIAAERWTRTNRWRVPMVVTLFNDAVRAGQLDTSPFAGLGRRTEGRKRIDPLTEAELETMASAALTVHGAYGPTMRALVLFLAYTGLRPGEVFALEWGDVDFERMRVRIERRVYRGSIDLPKSNRPRLIVLTPPARDALLHLSRDGRLVFTGKRGGALTQSLLTWYWQPVQARMARKVTPYELRHFAAHHLYVRMNLPARVVAAQLGHDGPKLVETLYGHGEVGALEEIDAAFADNVVPLRQVGGESHGQ